MAIKLQLKYLKVEMSNNRAKVIYKDDQIVGVSLKRLQGRVLHLKYLSDEAIEYLKNEVYGGKSYDNE